jgi:hypothetical protein
MGADCDLNLEASRNGGCKLRLQANGSTQFNVEDSEANLFTTLRMNGNSIKDNSGKNSIQQTNNGFGTKISAEDTIKLNGDNDGTGGGSQAVVLQQSGNDKFVVRNDKNISNNRLNMSSNPIDNISAMNHPPTTTDFGSSSVDLSVNTDTWYQILINADTDEDTSLVVSTDQSGSNHDEVIFTQTEGSTSSASNTGNSESTLANLDVAGDEDATFVVYYYQKAGKHAKIHSDGSFVDSSGNDVRRDVKVRVITTNNVGTLTFTLKSVSAGKVLDVRKYEMK